MFVRRPSVFSIPEVGVVWKPIISAYLQQPRLTVYVNGITLSMLLPKFLNDLIRGHVDILNHVCSQHVAALHRMHNVYYISLLQPAIECGGLQPFDVSSNSNCLR